MRKENQPQAQGGSREQSRRIEARGRTWLVLVRHKKDCLPGKVVAGDACPGWSSTLLFWPADHVGAENWGFWRQAAQKLCLCRAWAEAAERYTAMDALCWPAGAGALHEREPGYGPLRLLIMRLWVTSGTAAVMPPAAAAAQAAVTPGITRQGIPSASSRAACSRSAPYSEGSPVCTLPRGGPPGGGAHKSVALLKRQRCGIHNHGLRCGAGHCLARNQRARIEHRAASSIALRPLMVMRSGSPGQPQQMTSGNLRYPCLSAFGLLCARLDGGGRGFLSGQQKIPGSWPTGVHIAAQQPSSAADSLQNFHGPGRVFKKRRYSQAFVEALTEITTHQQAQNKKGPELINAVACVTQTPAGDCAGPQENNA